MRRISKKIWIFILVCSSTLISILMLLAHIITLKKITSAISKDLLDQLFYRDLFLFFCFICIMCILVYFTRIYTLSKAHIDPLTGLSDRKKLYSDLNYQINKGNEFSVIYIDFNKFKYINDTLGHDFGDGILKYFSDKISIFIKRDAHAYRLGGDEFLIVVYNQNNLDYYIQSLEAINNSNIKIGNEELLFSFSIGVAIYPYHAADTRALIHIADKAMYYAKSNKLAYYICDEAFVKKNFLHKQKEHR